MLRYKHNSIANGKNSSVNATPITSDFMSFFFMKFSGVTVPSSFQTPRAYLYLAVSLLQNCERNKRPLSLSAYRGADKKRGMLAPLRMVVYYIDS